MTETRHSEAAFETVIEAHLLQNGYRSVPREGFDRERAIFPEGVLEFIRETQPMIEWEKLDTIGERTITMLEERRSLIVGAV
jgi:type I restriction enzyme R subunit